MKLSQLFATLALVAAGAAFAGGSHDHQPAHRDGYGADR